MAIALDVIHDTLATVRPGTAVRHDALTVVPLLGPAQPEPTWLTLAEAGEAVRITEVTDAGEVPTLEVTSDADCPVLLLDGEELIGAKQNRIVNTTALLAPHARTIIPVSCVEQGRWSHRGERSRSSDYALYASVRRKKAAWVSERVRRTGRHDSDQAGVWKDLADTAARLGVWSPTDAMHVVYERYAPDLEDARAALAPVPDQVGALVVIAENWAGLELLAAPGLFARTWPRLLSGYAADALGLMPGSAHPDPIEILARIMTATREPAPAVGLGAEFRLGGGEVVGAALVAEERVAHLAAFPVPAR
jgi:hypothetical protein